MRLRQRTVLVVFATVVLVAAPAFAAQHTVQIVLTSFSPVDLTVQAGDTVTWINNSFLQHTVTSGSNCSPSGVFGSPLLNPDAEFSHTFLVDGTFSYYCTPHCLAGMRGSITVATPVAVATTTWGAIKALYATRVSP
jgi:plastocyanin